MSALKRVLQDLRTGENVDAYATAAVALTLVIFNLVRPIAPSQVASVTLAVLALLTIGNLVTRAKIESLTKNSVGGSVVSVYTRFPTSYETDLRGTGDLRIFGVSLSRTLTSYADAISNRLHLGAKVDVLLVRPKSPASVLAENRIAMEPDVASNDQSIYGSISVLRRIARESKGQLELRLTDQELSFGAIHVNPNASGARIYAEYYPYRIGNYNHLQLVLSPSDGHWYDLHARQMDNHWRDAQVEDLAGSGNQPAKARQGHKND